MCRVLYVKTIILILIAFLLSACNNERVSVVSPKHGKVDQYFVELASTHIDHPITLMAPLSGELDSHIKPVQFVSGDKVSKGQLIAQLRQLPLKLALEQAQALLQVDAARIVSEKHKLIVAEKDYDFQKKKLNRYRHLLSKKTTSAQQFEQIKLQADKSAQQLRQVHAQIKVTYAMLRSATINVQLAQHKLTISRLRSPVDGIILHVYYQSGSWINAGQKVVSIASIKNMNILSRVLTYRIHKLRVGQRVLIGLTRSQFPFTGKIDRIYPKGFTERSPLGVKEQRAGIIISPDDSRSLPLSAGYRVYIKFITHKHEGLILPRSAVLSDKLNKYFVFKYDNGIIKKGYVKIGIEDASNIAILSGLTLKDKVVVLPSVNMKDGQRVSLSR